MKITLEPTEHVVECANGDGEPSYLARVWEGFTESGIPVQVLIPRIAPVVPSDDPRQAEFERELVEVPAPRQAENAARHRNHGNHFCIPVEDGVVRWQR